MHKEGYLGIVLWGIFLMCHFQCAEKLFSLYSCDDLEGYILEQLEVIWEFDTQTVLHMQVPHDFKVCRAFALLISFCM